MPKKENIGNGRRLDPIKMTEDRIWWGKFAGERWKRLPKSYLLWMVNERIQQMDKAEAELERRGSLLDLGTLELSPHAIDRASQYCLDLFNRRKNQKDGLYKWLHENAIQALNMSHGEERSAFNGMIFVFAKKPLYNVLVTVIRDWNKK